MGCPWRRLRVQHSVALAEETSTAIGLHAGEIGGGDPHDARPGLKAAVSRALSYGWSGIAMRTPSR